MKNILKFKKYDPNKEYKTETRRKIDLDRLRKMKSYRMILDLGFKEDTSDQQSLNNTIKFIRNRERQKEPGHDKVFYTIHPSGIVRRYNPERGKEVPEGYGNDIKKFPEPFRKSSDYTKALNYLWQYLKRKESRGDFR